MHGVDWIVSDATAHLFIETKAKRLTVNARTLSDTTALDKDLIAMAKAIAQHYRNISDATNGRTHWASDDLPIYPIILTLEDWFLFSPRIAEMLSGHVLHFLAEANIGADVLEKMPYTIASAQDFETAIQIIAQVGIEKVMGVKTEADRRMWSLSAVISDRFNDQLRNVSRQIFGDALKDFISDVKQKIQPHLQ